MPLSLIDLAVLVLVGLANARWCGDDELQDPITGKIMLAQLPEDCAWMGLGSLELTRENMKDFATFMRKHDELIHLGLGGNQLGDTGIAELANGIRESGSGVEWLSLHSNRITDKGATWLAGALINHPTVKTLSLWDNDIGDEGLSALGDALEDNTVLRELSIALNPRITDAGIEALAHGLARNVGLKRLWIWGNPLVTRHGAAVLAQALSPHAGNVRVYLDDRSDDGHPNCPDWAATPGECARNAGYMTEVCATSCAKVAGVGGAAGPGSGVEETVADARGSIMQTWRGSSRGRPWRVGSDGHPECGAWAMQEGGCDGISDAHAQYMSDYCPVSCARTRQGINTHPHSGNPHGRRKPEARRGLSAEDEL